MRRLKEGRGHVRRKRDRPKCANGHEWTEKTTYNSPRGDRQCRVCLAAASRAYRERNIDEVRRRERERKRREYQQVHHGESIP